MNFPFYRGQGVAATAPGASLPSSNRAALRDPENYIAKGGLVDACNVALLLGQPLLLTGEAGTGKTQFAYSLAWELGLPKPLKFETRSTSSARELFYSYDSLKRFQDAQSGVRQESALPYLRYGPLGAAILRTRPRSEVAAVLTPNFQHDGPLRSVVLIDEVDKAPRDFPNDLLNEIEYLYFRIPELDDFEVETDPDLRPIIVVTSNSEKDLPDAFLRRCVYYDIPFPSPADLDEIVARRVGGAAGTDGFVRDALGLFAKLRDPAAGLRKRPSTAELLAWLVVLRELAQFDGKPPAVDERALRTINVLVKTAEDQTRAESIFRAWLRSSNRPPG